MDIKDCIKFKESLLNIMSETIILRDLIMAEISKNDLQSKLKNDEPKQDEEKQDEEKKVKRVSKPRPVNKLIEDVKKEDDNKKTKRQTKTKKECVVIDTDNLTLEI